MTAGLQSLYHRPFLLGCHSAKHRALLQQAAERAAVIRQFPRVDRPVGVGQPGLRRDGADGERTVPRDHFHRYTLRREVRDGLGGVGPQLFPEQNKRYRPQALWKRLAVQRAGGVRQRKDPPTAGGRPAACDNCSCSLPGRTSSGAPRIQLPWPAKLAALHLRADENGTAAVLSCHGRLRDQGRKARGRASVRRSSLSL